MPQSAIHCLLFAEVIHLISERPKQAKKADCLERLRMINTGKTKALISRNENLGNGERCGKGTAAVNVI
jgi:hypothetical protein